MKLQAITVCVNYTDLLRCVAANRSYFDRWVIVTHSSDRSTIDFCKSEGLEYLCSRRLYTGGAVFNKAKALNDGLDQLDQTGWVAVIDSDIYLPTNFRERLEAFHLNWRVLYGLEGRRVCNSYEEFVILSSREPWNLLWHSNSALGYFHLFHLSQKRSRYPEDTSTDASTYDMVFSDSFPDNLKAKLPIPCLHLGPVQENWRGRVSRKFVPKRGGTLRTVVAKDSAAMGELVRFIAPAGRRRSGSVVQLGYYTPEITLLLSDSFDQVFLIDEWGLHGEETDGLYPAGLGVVREEFDRAVAGRDNITRLGRHSTGAIAALADRSLDALYVEGEPDGATLPETVPRWLPKLKPRGFIAGKYFSITLFKETTQYISTCIGTPDYVNGQSYWACRIKHSIPAGGSGAPPRHSRPRCGYPVGLPLAHCESITPRNGDGILFFESGKRPIEDLLLSLESVRRKWFGHVTVISSGRRKAALQSSCARFGADLVEVGGLDFDPGSEAAKVRALLLSPFEKTLYLELGAEVRRPLDAIFEMLEEHQLLVAIGGGEAAMRMRIEKTVSFARSHLFDGAELIDYALAEGSACGGVLGFNRSAPGSDWDIVQIFSEILAKAERSNGSISLAEFAGLAIAKRSINHGIMPGGWIKPFPANGGRASSRTLIHVTSFPSQAVAAAPSPQHRREAECRILSRLASPVRVRDDCTVITAIVPENVDAFLRNFTTWKFAPNRSIMAVLCDLTDEQVAAVDRMPGIVSARYKSPFPYDPECSASGGLLSICPESVQTGYSIFVNPGCFPEPGAKLFDSSRFRRYGVVGCGWRNTRSRPIESEDDLRAFLQNPTVPVREADVLTGIGMIRTDVLGEAGRLAVQIGQAPIFDTLVSAAACKLGCRVTAARIGGWGWTGL